MPIAYLLFEMQMNVIGFNVNDRLLPLCLETVAVILSVKKHTHTSTSSPFPLLAQSEAVPEKGSVSIWFGHVELHAALKNASNTNWNMMTCVVFNELKVPLVGLTTWAGDPNVEQTVREALKAGCRYFKCSERSDFGRVGEALKAAMEEGLVTREDLRVAGELNDVTVVDVESHLRDALFSLQLDYFDIYMLRFSAEMKMTTVIELWKKLEILFSSAKGLVKVPGVSNTSIYKISALCSAANIHPFVCEAEMHPLFPQNELLDYCREKRIHCIACAPFAAGEITKPYSHQRLSHESNLLKHEAVLAVAIALNKTPAQVLVRWALQRGTSVLLPTINPDRLRENLDVFDWELSAEQVESLNHI